MDESLRLSDAERETAIGDLREHVAQGRLTLEEFSERVDAALRARVVSDLEPVRSGLPLRSTGTVQTTRKRTRFTVALIAHVVRRGRLRLGRWSTAVSVLSDIDLDLREASVDGLLSTVSVLALVGNVDVYVPEGIDVDVSGLTAFGHRRDWGHDVSSPGAPSIRIRILGIVATVDVWRVPSGAPSDLGMVIAQVRSSHRPGAVGPSDDEALPPPT
jgi:uncharacterized protein DUF1707